MTLIQPEIAPPELLVPDTQKLQAVIDTAREALENTNTDEKIQDQSIATRRRISGVLELPNIDQQATDLFYKVLVGLRAIAQLKPNEKFSQERINLINSWIDDLAVWEKSADKTRIFKITTTMRDLFREEEKAV